ncbi:hypothetical protein L596_008379 [Steinernema carpocapsae]|uniref:UDP-N-acetylglucosamine transferase subunit ALG14 n=1 Tax=Steinernema carpocapsae TaxID=34508 RepID=A0A4U5PCT8_STECR|nr:hypothetical protein L596_008379 [Steinernema carpocapsae]
MMPICFLVLGFPLAILGILFVQFLRRHARNANFSYERRLCAVMGSGGHTTEMLLLLDEIAKNYSHRFYVIADTDRMSERKVLAYERKADGGSFEVLKTPRSREVGQSYATAVFSTLNGFFAAFRIVWTSRPDVIFSNGPGTALPICVVGFLLDLLRLRDIRIHFIESYCRVRSLSLTGLLLYHLRITDSFVVQWEDVHVKYPRSEFIGRLL